jgi:hypothetical protein
MYEQLHEEAQTLHENTESFKVHTWETTAELRHLIQGMIDRNVNSVNARRQYVHGDLASIYPVNGRGSGPG